MKYILSIIIATVAAVAIASCSGNTCASDKVHEAEQAVIDGDITGARDMADRLVADINLDDMSATGLARLSMVYMQVADEENDNSALVATAADLYRRACRTDADSAKAYYASLPPAKQALASHLFHIVTATDSAAVMPAEEPIDTVI